MLFRFIQRLLNQSSNTSSIPNESLSVRISEILSLFASIDELMPNDQTSDNWRRIFSNIQSTLRSKANQQGINEAYQTWQSIHGGMGSWNDYYIPHDDQETMTRLNEELKILCYRLTGLLNGSADS